MGKYSTNDVIQSLAKVTRHADREALETSLANTIYELLNVEKVLLYKIFYNTEDIECYCYLVVEDGHTKVMDSTVSIKEIDQLSIPGFADCMESKEMVSTQSKDDCNTILFPITDKFNNVVSVFRIERPVVEKHINETFLGAYFQIYKNYLHLLDESERDTLTNLLNRRTFDRDLQKILVEQSTAQGMHDAAENLHRRNDSLPNSNWLAATDIDHFKSVNDNYGHLYGDEVLLLLANIMRETFRGSDILFRFGGEEFIIILRATDQQGAYNALERFRATVEAYRFPQVGKVTISGGYVEITEHSIPTEILGHADEALYYAKDQGRNQFHQYETLVADGHIIIKDAPEDDIELF